MKQLINKTLELSKQFPNQFTKQNRFLDLIEEVGELAQAMLMFEKIKTTSDPAKQRTINDVADGICDALYNLIMLADDYELDLEAEYEKMLQNLETRIKAGEFNRREYGR